MIHKRQNGFVRIILEPAKSRIERGECPSCGLPKTEWKRSTRWLCCSTDCTSKFNDYCIIREWNTMRNMVFSRDDYRCVKCHRKSLKTEYVPSGEVGDRMIMMLESRAQSERRNYEIRKIENTGHRAFIFIDEPDGSGLVADHIRPIALGGPQWSLENIQTLCMECNKIKTKMDQSVIAGVRRKDKILDSVQRELAV